MADGFGFTDVGQKLVAKTFTFGRAFHRARDIHEPMVVGRMRCGLTISASLSRRGSGIGTTPVFGLNGTEGEVGRFNTRFGERIEQGGLPTLGKPTIPHLNPMI